MGNVMSAISSTLPTLAYQSSGNKNSGQTSSFEPFCPDSSTSNQDPGVEKFDFRHMSSDRLQTALPQIINEAHLTIEEQLELGGGFIRNALTKVDPNGPDVSAQDQNILAGLQIYRTGDLSRGDTAGAASFEKIFSELSALQQ